MKTAGPLGEAGVGQQRKSAGSSKDSDYRSQLGELGAYGNAPVSRRATAESSPSKGEMGCSSFRREQRREQTDARINIPYISLRYRN